MSDLLNNLILVILTILPIFVLMWFTYYNDKIEKEPPYLLFILFLGGIICSIFSYFISSYINKVVFLNYNYNDLNFVQLLFKSFVSIALVEEGLKWIVNFIVTWKNKNFNYMYDQIVYSSYVALGFAFFENIIYCLNFAKYGYMPMILRAIISIPSHAVFGVIMGYYLSIAKNAKSNSKKKNKYIKYLFKSIFVPILLHSIFDLILFKLNTFFSIILIFFLIIIYLLALQKIKKLSNNKTLLN